jgi:hypothetical protein
MKQMGACQKQAERLEDAEKEQAIQIGMRTPG